MDELLLLLLKKEAHRAPIRITTTEIGSELGMSQQNVSRRLAILEEEGVISRDKNGIKISEKGIAQIKDLQATIANAFSPKFQMCGKIVAGLGEGKFYLSHFEYSKGIKKKFGFDPYPGTLNVLLDKHEEEKRRRLLALDPIIIGGFEKSGRTFGDLFAYKAEAEGIDCVILVPLRTHHGSDILEIAAAVNLKKKLGKKDGDSITVSL
jgi:riboflavin kinase